MGKFGKNLGVFLCVCVFCLFVFSFPSKGRESFGTAAELERNEDMKKYVVNVMSFVSNKVLVKN